MLLLLHLHLLLLEAQHCVQLLLLLLLLLLRLLRLLRVLRVRRVRRVLRRVLLRVLLLLLLHLLLHLLLLEALHRRLLLSLLPVNHDSAHQPSRSLVGWYATLDPVLAGAGCKPAELPLAR